VTSVDAATPFAGLTPDCILAALESLGLPCDGRLLALNSFENRVWQVGVEEPDGRSAFRVAKFYRPGRWSDAAILEEHAFLAELAEAELPVVPPLLLQSATLNLREGYRVAVFPRRGGRAPELEDPLTLAWMGRLLGRIHAIGALRPFAHRRALTPESFGTQSRQFLLGQGHVPAELAEAYASVSAQALEGVAACYQRAGAVTTLRLHGDCHRGNVLWTEEGPHFVDFDDATTGPAVQDLWMLLAGDEQAMARQLDAVLEGYGQFARFDCREIHLIEALRTLRQMHHAAWIARRWRDPAFPVAFPWFDSVRYWQDHILALREQVALMAESPLVRLMV
jgi:Ser/Thr protein kinase RdoA (MazF antagonist)